jgi:hypothetical protein
MQLPYPSPIDWDKVNQPGVVYQQFASRRSVVYGTKGMVASSQPLASEAGLEILRKGGNAGAYYPRAACGSVPDAICMRSGRGCRRVCRTERD